MRSTSPSVRSLASRRVRSIRTRGRSLGACVLWRTSGTAPARPTPSGPRCPRSSAPTTRPTSVRTCCRVCRAGAPAPVSMRRRQLERPGGVRVRIEDLRDRTAPCCIRSVGSVCLGDVTDERHGPSIPDSSADVVATLLELHHDRRDRLQRIRRHRRRSGAGEGTGQLHGHRQEPLARRTAAPVPSSVDTELVALDVQHRDARIVAVIQRLYVYRAKRDQPCALSLKCGETLFTHEPGADPHIKVHPVLGGLPLRDALEVQPRAHT